MKKLIGFCAALLCCSMSFAKVELDVAVAGVPVFENYVEFDSFGATAVVPFATGITENLDIFFKKDSVSPWEFGMNINNATIFNTRTVFDNKSQKGFSITNDLEAGVVFRYSFDKVNTFYFSPGIAMSFAVLHANEDDDTGYLNFGSGPHVNVGYRAFFVNRPGFHLGFNCGADYAYVFGVPVQCDNIWGSRSEYKTGDFFSANKLKIYAGISFHFGDRSIDLRRENTALEDSDGESEEAEASDSTDSNELTDSETATETTAAVSETAE